MNKFATGTICSKHGEIENIFEYIRDNSTDFSSEIERGLILISQCLDDGNRMEQKLKYRKKEADEMQDNISYLEKQISALEYDLANCGE